MTSLTEAASKDIMGDYHGLGEILSRLQRLREAVQATMELPDPLALPRLQRHREIVREAMKHLEDHLDPFVVCGVSFQISAAPVNSTGTLRAQNEGVDPEFSGLEDTTRGSIGLEDMKWECTALEGSTNESTRLEDTSIAESGYPIVFCEFGRRAAREANTLSVRDTSHQAPAEDTNPKPSIIIQIIRRPIEAIKSNEAPTSPTRVPVRFSRVGQQNEVSEVSVP